MRLAHVGPCSTNRSRCGNKNVFSLMEQEMNRLFPQFATNGSSVLTPRLDASETEADFQIVLEVPGLSENEIDIELNDDTLRIRGEKKDERIDNGRNYHRSERLYGKFERTLTLPTPVDREKTEATFKNGVLTITLPKVKVAETTHKIAVKPV